MRLGALAAGDMPAAYVRTLFDQYAPRFDAALTEGLGYRGPAILREAIEGDETIAVELEDAAREADLLFPTHAGPEIGVASTKAFTTQLAVLAAFTIAMARAKDIYDRLEIGDLVQFMQAEARERRAYSLIVAADVFAYLAWLPPVIAAAARVLAPGGLLAFTVETHEGDDVILGEKLRYEHGAAHVRMAVAGAGLTLMSLVEDSTRSEAGAPVAGLVVVAHS